MDGNLLKQAYMAYKSCLNIIAEVYWIQLNKLKGLKVAKEELKSIGSMVDRLDGR